MKVLKVIAAEADRAAKAIGASARRGDQSLAETFRFIRDTAKAAAEDKNMNWAKAWKAAARFSYSRGYAAGRHSMVAVVRMLAESANKTCPDCLAKRKGSR